MGIVCASLECEHNNGNCRCKLKKVTLSDHHIHTVNEGLQHFWRCKQYEENEMSKRFREDFLKVMEENNEDRNTSQG